jgi:hypothetical protein
MGITEFCFLCWEVLEITVSAVIHRGHNRLTLPIFDKDIRRSARAVDTVLGSTPSHAFRSPIVFRQDELGTAQQFSHARFQRHFATRTGAGVRQSSRTSTGRSFLYGLVWNMCHFSLSALTLHDSEFLTDLDLIDLR